MVFCLDQCAFCYLVCIYPRVNGLLTSWALGKAADGGTGTGLAKHLTLHNYFPFLLAFWPIFELIVLLAGQEVILRKTGSCKGARERTSEAAIDLEKKKGGKIRLKDTQQLKQA